MKPVNRNLADEFHENSEDGVDAVLERMLEVVGRPMGGGYTEIFDVSANTIKTWRRRGAISTAYLEGFAKKWGVSLDRLMYGKPREGEADLILSTAEKTLVVQYRSAPKELRDAALRVLHGDGSPPPGVKVGGRSRVGQVAGRNIVNVGGGKKK